MANGLPSVRSTIRPAVKWQWVAIISGLLLASCFFAPMGYGKGGLVNPCRGVAEILSEIRLPSSAGYEPMALAGVFLAGFVAPYAVGLVAGLSAVARRYGLHRLTSLSSVLMVLVLAVYCASALGYVVAYVARWGIRAIVGYLDYPSLEFGASGFLGVVPVLTLGYLLVSLRAKRQGSFCRVFLGSSLTVLWFGAVVLLWVFLGPGVLYGSWLSLASSLMLLVATVGEATSVTRQSWGRTTLQLATCRLAAPADMTGRCPKCDYLLYGLAEQRCPECGRAFTFDEIGATPEEMAFGGSKSKPGQE